MNQKKAKEERRRLRGEVRLPDDTLLIPLQRDARVALDPEAIDYLQRRVTEMTVEYAPWTPFEQVQPRGYLCEPGETVWVNSRYTVYYRVQAADEPGQPDLLHLSFKRNDKEPIHDWREIQRLKNEIVGPEQEMVELYPAESRLVDTSNQFHLWGIRGLEMPFGFRERLVMEVPDTGGKQRPFEPGARPDDVQHPDDPELRERINQERTLKRGDPDA